MEVIRGSIYVEVESVLGIFTGAAISSSASPTAHLQSQLPEQGAHDSNSGSGSAGHSATTTATLSDEAAAAAAGDDVDPLRERAMSSHSPFGPTPSATSIFATRLPPHTDAPVHVAAEPLSAEKRKEPCSTPAGSSPGVSTSVCVPVTVLEAAYPPPMLVQFGEELHVIDPHARTTDASAMAAEMPLLRAGAEGPRHMKASAGASGAGPATASSSRGSPPPPTGRLAVWESVLHLVDDAGSEAEDCVSQQEGATHTSTSTPPRSFRWDSASSTTEAEEPAVQAGTMDERYGNYSGRSSNRNITSPGSPAGAGPLPRVTPRVHNNRFLIRASPVFAAGATPTRQAVPPHQATLSWLVARLHNDPAVLRAITLLGPRPRAVQNAHDHHTTTSTPATAAADFVAAWYTRLFPEFGEDGNVLEQGTLALLSTRRALRRHCPDLTAAIFPLCQRFAFTKVAIAVRSAAAFDLQEAIQRGPQKGKSHAHGASAAGGAGGGGGGGPDTDCLVIRLATAAEVKKAQRAAVKGSSGTHRKGKSVEDFFEHLRSSFRGRKSKEKTLSAESSLHEDGGGGDAHTPPDSAARSHTQAHSRVLSLPHSNASSPTASATKEARTSGHRRETSTTTATTTAATGEAFAARLHLSRLLSPSILAWMKSRHAYNNDNDSCENEGDREGDADAAMPTWPDAAVAAGARRGSCSALSEWAGVGTPSRADPERPAVFFKSVYLPLPSPLAAGGEGGPCLAMMVKVNVLFKPGLDSAEPF